MYLRVWVLGEHVAELWSLKPSPRDEPPPEVPSLFAPSERAPQTQPQRKIEDQNRICHGEADREGIVGTQVPVHDPARLACELPLHLHPLFPRQRRQAGLPKMFIQLDDGKTNEFAESAANGRFSGPTSTKNNNALHCHIFMLARPESLSGSGGGFLSVPGITIAPGRMSPREIKRWTPWRHDAAH